MIRFAVAWLPLVALAAGCHHGDGALLDDGFRSRLARGCRSEPDCLVLELDAQARADRCVSACEEAEADLRASRALVARHRQQREARQAQIAAQQQDGEAAEREAAEREAAEREAAEREAAEREAARVAEEQRARKAVETPVSAQPGGRSGAQEPPRPASEGRVCCCDGTLSPTCTHVKRGCCSHHGGVCACP
ncbi:hypothetical protein [Sorangium sp. So ce406]|uniref:hypothetical protein n=1 Tax=Sorangium sp. So ce406 TaxID=3133311 RepID=UPI003F5AFCF2